MLIVARAVKRGLGDAAPSRSPHRPRREGFGRDQDYVSLMMTLKNRRVLEVVPGRSTTDAIALLETHPPTNARPSWPPR
ncbi:MAG: hypothetical protein IPL39_21720 [Opitutaceae bacterium]|nr:hypothetical protein [Opitutaceae bacterium]